MALQLEATYSKKLGLPGYSSHQFSVSIKTELADINHVRQETKRLYGLLQSSVDQGIQRTGFLPGESQENGHSHVNGTASGHNNGTNYGHPDIWKCSDKQRDLILKIVEENCLDKNEVESLARQRFNASVKMLNKLQASGLIDELIEKYGSTPPARNGNGRYPSRRNANGATK